MAFQFESVLNNGGGGGGSYTAGDGIDITSDVISTKQSVSGDMDEIVDVLPAGGMGVTIASAFNKSDLYSTDEKMIGQWTNGKPIYAKTIDFGNLPSANSTVAHNIADVDNIVSVTGVAISASNVSLQIPLYRDDANFVGITADRTTVYFWTKGYSNYSAKLTIVYTKTTDSIVAIGEATSYSTTEKIVGTWIDGSPIWQKTIVDTLPSISQADMLAGNFARKTVAVGANVKLFISISGISAIAEGSSSATLYNSPTDCPLPNPLVAKNGSAAYDQGQAVIGFTHYSSTDPDTIRLQNQNTFFGAMPVVITVQYIKV